MVVVGVSRVSGDSTCCTQGENIYRLLHDARGSPLSTKLSQALSSGAVMRTHLFLRALSVPSLIPICWQLCLLMARHIDATVSSIFAAELPQGKAKRMGISSERFSEFAQGTQAVKFFLAASSSA